ncbi:hypothetical protein IW261DRAFT_1661331 [Armillaria novae-zelandiae]|uniref:F-box domain-containing protein n=1 Tax=Armillaria novae-zelandiae TaxID=153914 RepID=A0AA39NVS1_9AGAR|nr:hypothetical protein IW261DRAFT_1661331 [Armillaria novae-zelandiae]
MSSNISCSICGSTGELTEEQQLRIERYSIKNTRSIDFGDLPPRVLQKIFLALIDDNGFNFSDTSQGPWIFTYVCSSWRTAALDHSCLWSHIILDASSLRAYSNHPAVYLKPHFRRSLKASKYRRRQDPLSLLSIVLTRAGSHDLSVKVDYSTGNIDPNQSFLMRVLLLRLAQKSRQWRSALLCLPRYMMDDLSVVSGQFPKLVGLHLALYNNANPGNNDVITIFETAPMLTVVTLQGCALSTQISLPYQRLVHFHDDRSDGRQVNAAFPSVLST